MNYVEVLSAEDQAAYEAQGYVYNGEPGYGAEAEVGYEDNSYVNNELYVGGETDPAADYQYEEQVYEEVYPQEEEPAYFNIGDVCEAYWEQDETWYEARIDGYNEETYEYLVTYLSYQSQAYVSYSYLRKHAAAVGEAAASGESGDADGAIPVPKELEEFMSQLSQVSKSKDLTKEEKKRLQEEEKLRKQREKDMEKERKRLEKEAEKNQKEAEKERKKREKEQAKLEKEQEKERERLEKEAEKERKRQEKKAAKERKKQEAAAPAPAAPVPAAPYQAPPTAAYQAPPVAPVYQSSPTATYQAPPAAPYQAPPTAAYQAPPVAPVYQSSPPTASYQAPPTAAYQAPPAAPVYQSSPTATYQAPPPVPVSSYQASPSPAPTPVSPYVPPINTLAVPNQVAEPLSPEDTPRTLQDKERKTAALRDQFEDGEELAFPGRFIVSRGQLWKKGRFSDKKYYYFLFTDMLVEAEFNGKSGKFKVRKTFLIDSNFSLSGIPDASGEKSNRFEFTHGPDRKHFTVYSKSPEEKAGWLEDVSRLTRKYQSRAAPLTSASFTAMTSTAPRSPITITPAPSSGPAPIGGPRGPPSISTGGGARGPGGDYAARLRARLAAGPSAGSKTPTPISRGSPSRGPPSLQSAKSTPNLDINLDSDQTRDRSNTSPRRGPADKLVKEWTIDDVQTWLKDLKFENYSTSFRDELVDGEVLITLTDDDLQKQLKITKSLHLKRMRQKLTSVIKEADEQEEKYDSKDAPDVLNWGVDRVIEWLKKLSFDKYVKDFEENKVDGELLVTLEDDDIIDEMNVRKDLHFRRLRMKIDYFSMYFALLFFAFFLFAVSLLYQISSFECVVSYFSSSLF